VAEFGSSGTLLRRYTHGAGVDDPLIVYDDGTGVASTALRRLRTDHQGSITVVVNNAGTRQKLNSYDGASGVAEQQHGIPAANNATIAQGAARWLQNSTSHKTRPPI
jgi:hypothetical protein